MSRRPPGRPTFIAKATCSLTPQAPCTLATRQRAFSRDVPHMDAIGRSLAWSNDLVPFKPNTDFLILGSFHQPGGVAAPEGPRLLRLRTVAQGAGILTVRVTPGRSLTGPGN
ncbi:MAG: DUF2169 domain-containing protein [Acetobacteraceae bacterium]